MKRFALVMTASVVTIVLAGLAGCDKYKQKRPQTTVRDLPRPVVAPKADPATKSAPADAVEEAPVPAEGPTTRPVNDKPAAAPSDQPTTRPAPAVGGDLWKTGEVYLVRRAAGEITIDAKPHPEQWAGAMVIKDFKIPVTLKPVRAETQARMLWDDQCLYAEFLARDKDLLAKYTKRDDPLWNEDVVEMFLKPSAKPPYYEFEVNPLGTVMALEIPDRDKKGTLAEMSQWETGIRSAVQVGGTINESKDRDDFYRVIMAIPWKNLKVVGGKPPAEGELWKFTICRYDYSKDLQPEEQTSAPLTDQSFHHHEDYSTLKFAK